MQMEEKLTIGDKDVEILNFIKNNKNTTLYNIAKNMINITEIQRQTYSKKHKGEIVHNEEMFLKSRLKKLVEQGILIEKSGKNKRNKDVVLFSLSDRIFYGNISVSVPKKKNFNFIMEDGMIIRRNHKMFFLFDGATNFGKNNVNSINK